VHPKLNPDSIISWNPQSYYAYLLAGDYFMEHNDFGKAIPAYTQGLTKEIATIQEREHMEKNLRFCKMKLK
jgi:isopenicillin-N N-acyltransferase like protein